MSKRKEKIILLVSIILMTIITLLMWDIDRFLGFVLLAGLIAMVGMYIAVAIESTSSEIDY